MFHCGRNKMLLDIYELVMVLMYVFCIVLLRCVDGITDGAKENEILKLKVLLVTQIVSLGYVAITFCLCENYVQIVMG